jgi:asparagine synthase (glutamine-hydrolysing)
MCGIAGLADRRGVDRESVAARLERASLRLAPRGPDGAGIWIGEHAAFAHRRLAIIALGPDGAQPMHAHGLSITYNGEIYNHAELRAELESRGRRFASRSDTEVLLAGWAEWGPALLDRLIGMFAFAIWDETRRELVLVRDRFGKKPLFYSVENDRVAFASEFLALEHVAGKTFQLDPDAVAWLFALRWLPDHVAIGRGAKKLGPGEMLRFDHKGVRVERWYDLDTRSLPAIADHAAAKAALIENFDAAVRARLVSDVSVGAFLSSGIDSSLVVAAMARAGVKPRSFTIGFDDAAFLDERKGAAAVARHVGAEHTEIAVAASDAPALLDDVVRGLDEPFADASAIPTFAVSRATRAHVTVALSGDGADEVFGGYRKYQGEIWARRWACVPTMVRNSAARLIEALPERRGSSWGEALRRARRFVAGASSDGASRHAAWMQDVPDDELAALLPGAAPGRVRKLIADAAHERGDALNLVLARDLATTLPGDMLTKVDRTSMANSLEVRCPFLDQRVVETATAIPGNFKIANGMGKKILREAFADRLPAEVFARPKRGFELPVGAWLKGALREDLTASCDDAALRRQGLLNAARVVAWRHETRRDVTWRLWTLLILQRWLAVHRRAEAL